MNTLAPSFLIGSASFLHVRRATIKSSMRLNGGQIPPLILELYVLEGLKKLMYNVVNTLCP